MKKNICAAILASTVLSVIIFMVAVSPFLGDNRPNNITVLARVYSDAVFYASAQNEGGKEVVLSEQEFNRVENAATSAWIKNGEVKEITIK